MEKSIIDGAALMTTEAGQERLLFYSDDQDYVKLALRQKGTQRNRFLDPP